MNFPILQETKPISKRRHPQNLNDAELEMIESNVHETEVPFEESQTMKQVSFPLTLEYRILYHKV